MTSNSDDLEEQLRQNLKLRRELAAEVAAVRDSSAKERRDREVVARELVAVGSRGLGEARDVRVGVRAVDVSVAGRGRR